MLDRPVVVRIAGALGFPEAARRIEPIRRVTAMVLDAIGHFRADFTMEASLSFAKAPVWDLFRRCRIDTSRTSSQKFIKIGRPWRNST